MQTNKNSSDNKILVLAVSQAFDPILQNVLCKCVHLDQSVPSHPYQTKYSVRNWHEQRFHSCTKGFISVDISKVRNWSRQLLEFPAGFAAVSASFLPPHTSNKIHRLRWIKVLLVVFEQKKKWTIYLNHLFEPFITIIWILHWIFKQRD